jgi:hypothetical protein
VDGGAVARAFLYPTALRLQDESRRLGIVRERTGYLIRNGRIDPEWTNTERSFMSLTRRFADRGGNAGDNRGTIALARPDSDKTDASR